MSFGSLPIIVFIFLVLASALGVFILAWKSRSENFKIIPIIFILYGLGGIGGGFLKVNQKAHFLKNSSLVFWPTMFCTIISIILTFIVAYFKVKNDSQKKKYFLRIFFLTFGITFILILLGIYFFLKIKNII